jgi:Flp pilus assembly protein TadG
MLRFIGLYPKLTPTSLTRDSKGSIAIEFAIVFPIFLLFVMGIIEFGYIFWGLSSLQFGASYGARYSYVNPTASSTTIRNQALSKISLPSSAITYSVSTTSNVSTDITGTFTYTFLFLPVSPITVTTQVHQVLPPAS